MTTLVRPNISVPRELWQKLKIKAAREAISLNDAAVEAIKRYAGLESLVSGKPGR